jgi:exodeoxyribonuclease VII large subunit
MNEKIKTVSELTYEISRALSEHIGYSVVKGEVSNFTHHSSGHRYFTIKDEAAQLSCVMWRSRKLGFNPTDGMEVILRGNITVYPPRGQYQMDVTSMMPVGEGDLYLAFEALKKKLSDLGYFDSARKKPLPDIPLNIGVATSATGAAQRDIISTIERRFPLCTIYFRNTIVQGDAAAEDIAMAISELESHPIDVIIIGRGGGSLEDLWPFNTETVANAIYKAKVPIVSAVGHETDFSISDFVADVRAATPTAAAEMVTSLSAIEILSQLELISKRMTKSITNEILSKAELLNTFQRSYTFRTFPDRVRNFAQEIDEFQNDLQKNIKRVLIRNSDRLDSTIAHLNSLHPMVPLRKGFAILRDGDTIIPNGSSLRNYDKIIIERYDEKAEAEIRKVHTLDRKNI